MPSPTPTLGTILGSMAIEIQPSYEEVLEISQEGVQHTENRNLAERGGFKLSE
jgi:hypothetical protein